MRVADEHNCQTVPTKVTVSIVGQQVSKVKIMSAIESKSQTEIDNKRRENRGSITYVKGTKLGMFYKWGANEISTVSNLLGRIKHTMAQIF